VDGNLHPVNHIHDAAGAATAAPGLAVVPSSFSLQEIIQLRQATGHPVLLAEQGRVLGVCGEAEIIRALAGSRRAHA
jgi:glycine betaine/proline transport system ATP-binding protein